MNETTISEASIEINSIIRNGPSHIAADDFYKNALTAGENKGSLLLAEEVKLTMGAAEHDFTCYYTLRDTSRTGEKKIKPHNITKKIVCRPNSVFSLEAYEVLTSWQELKCPICICNSDTTAFEDIKPLKEEISSDLLNEPNCDVSLHEKFVITKTFMTDDDQSYKKLDEYKFEVTSYEIDAPVVQDSWGLRTVENRTPNEFNESVNQRYPFLRDIDMKDVYIAGGFCRSVLLKFP